MLREQQVGQIGFQFRALGASENRCLDLLSSRAAIALR